MDKVPIVIYQHFTKDVINEELCCVSKCINSVINNSKKHEVTLINNFNDEQKKYFSNDLVFIPESDIAIDNKIFSISEEIFNRYDRVARCLRRWFYIYSFMEKNSLNSCVLIESDVFLFKSVDRFLKYFNKNDERLQGLNTFNILYIPSKEYLMEFCKIVMEIYYYIGDDEEANKFVEIKFLDLFIKKNVYVKLTDELIFDPDHHHTHEFLGGHITWMK